MNNEPDLDDDAKELARRKQSREGNDISAARDRVEDTSGEDEEGGGYEEGFTMKTFIGALFVGLIMAPGAIYLGLVAGKGLGPAAQ